jgi:hypothetical protein
MRVSIPVMIISLKEGQSETSISETANVVVPLPRLKTSSVNVQRPKADETRDDLSCNSYECLSGLSRNCIQTSSIH